MGLRHCADVPCTSVNTDVAWGPSPLAQPSLAKGADGLMRISNGAFLARCTDVGCTNFVSLGQVAPGAIGRTALTSSNGLGLIAFQVQGELRVTRCHDVACASFTVSVLDDLGVGQDPDVAIGSDGLALISYMDFANGTLKVAHCNDAACTSARLSVLDGDTDSADLSATVTDSSDPVVGLQEMLYRVLVTNNGPDPVPPTVTYVLPAGVQFRQGGGSGCQERARTVTCTGSADLAPGETTTFYIYVVTPPTAQVLSSTFSVASAAADAVPGNNTATETTVVTAAPTADLAVAVSDGGTAPRWGQPFTWTITATSGGPDTVTGLVSNQLPDGITSVTWSCTASPGSSCQNGTGALASEPVILAAGGMVTFTVTGTVGVGALTLVNEVSIHTYTDVWDPVSANNQAATTAYVREPTQAYVVTPCRVIDTRSSPPALGANSERGISVAGLCGVPADARAVAVNVTAVNPGESGNLRLFPGYPRPLASALNFAAGRTRAGNAIVALSSFGWLVVRCDMSLDSTASTHFVMDVYAYFK